MQTIIVVVYLLTMVGIGIALRGRIRSASDFLIAGGKLGLLLTTATFAAIQLGAGVITRRSRTCCPTRDCGRAPGQGISVGGGLIIAGFIAAKRLRRRGLIRATRLSSRTAMVTTGQSGYGRGSSNIPSLLGVSGDTVHGHGYGRGNVRCQL